MEFSLSAPWQSINLTQAFIFNSVFPQPPAHFWYIQLLQLPWPGCLRIFTGFSSFLLKPMTVEWMWWMWWDSPYMWRCIRLTNTWERPRFPPACVKRPLKLSDNVLWRIDGALCSALHYELGTRPARLNVVPNIFNSAKKYRSLDDGRKCKITASAVSCQHFCLHLPERCNIFHSCSCWWYCFSNINRVQ